MKPVHLLSAALFALICSFTTSVDAQIVAGTDPVTNSGTPDGWTNVLYINEDLPFEFAGNGSGVLTYTNFYAANNAGMYTPFVAEPLVDDPVTGDDFIIRAIGTTRVGGVDYTCDGEFQFPFHDTETFTVQDGWVAGFLSADPLSESDAARSPIPFVGGAGVNGWLTGSGTAGTGLPVLEIGESILEGASGTDIDAYGLREYQFNISAVAGDTKPALDPGGRVGDACAGPPTPEAGMIGAPLPHVDGTPDGWSGVPVLYGYELPPGESVEVVRYYAADVRGGDVENEFYHVTPLIVRQEDGSVENGEGIFSIWEIGPNHTPNETGPQEFAWGSSLIPDDGNLYHPAVLQWNEGLDNTNGGVVAFGADGGTGMHFFDVETSFFLPDEDIGDLEPEYILSDLTIHTSGAGGRNYQLNFEMSGAGGEPGDFNRDGQLDSMDIDDLTAKSAAGDNPAEYDLTSDGAVDIADVNYWVKDLFGTWVGDASLDGEFNSSDLVQIFVAGTYELPIDSVWSTGDFNGDGRTNTADLVAAFADGGYELGPRQAVMAVPEPSSIFLTAMGLLIAGLGMHRRARGRIGC